MNPVVPTCSRGEHKIYGAGQPEYDPLPAVLLADGQVITEWQLTEAERDLIARGENIRLTLMTFGGPLQPVYLEITTPDGD